MIGGEPTLHSKLYDFCKKVYQETSNITITIYTNFSSKENFFRKLSDIGVRFEATYHLKNESFFNKVLKFSPKSFRTVTIMYEKTNSKKCISIYN